MLTKAGTVRTAIQQALVFVLAMAAGSCGRGAPADGVVQDRTTSALSGPWIYYPLDALNNWCAGYHAYGFNCPGPNCKPSDIHNSSDLAEPLNTVVTPPHP